MKTKYSINDIVNQMKTILSMIRNEEASQLDLKLTYNMLYELWMLHVAMEIEE